MNSSSKCDVVIVGAGPYGLSAAAHLRTITGLTVRVFGKPMSFWECNMPKGMLLRSNWTATRIADPTQSLTLEAFQQASGTHFSTPVPLERFVKYGQWYQRQALPDLDQREIVRIETGPNGFRITLGDGETFQSRRVVVAVGIQSFALPSERVRQLGRIAGLARIRTPGLCSDFQAGHVLVIGSGQSALESAALLNEAGAEVEVAARAHHIQWLQGWASMTLHHRLGGSIQEFALCTD